MIFINCESFSMIPFSSSPQDKLPSWNIGLAQLVAGDELKAISLLDRFRRSIAVSSLAPSSSSTSSSLTTTTTTKTTTTTTHEDPSSASSPSFVFSSSSSPPPLPPPHPPPPSSSGITSSSAAIPFNTNSLLQSLASRLQTKESGEELILAALQLCVEIAHSGDEFAISAISEPTILQLLITHSLNREKAVRPRRALGVLLSLLSSRPSVCSVVCTVLGLVLDGYAENTFQSVESTKKRDPLDNKTDTKTTQHLVINCLHIVYDIAKSTTLTSQDVAVLFHSVASKVLNQDTNVVAIVQKALNRLRLLDPQHYSELVYSLSSETMRQAVKVAISMDSPPLPENSILNTERESLSPVISSSSSSTSSYLFASLPLPPISLQSPSSSSSQLTATAETLPTLSPLRLPPKTPEKSNAQLILLVTSALYDRLEALAREEAIIAAKTNTTTGVLGSLFVPSIDESSKASLSSAGSNFELTHTATISRASLGESLLTRVLSLRASSETANSLKANDGAALRYLLSFSAKLVRDSMIQSCIVGMNILERTLILSRQPLLSDQTGHTSEKIFDGSLLEAVLAPVSERLSETKSLVRQAAIKACGTICLVFGPNSTVPRLLTFLGSSGGPGNEEKSRRGASLQQQLQFASNSVQSKNAKESCLRVFIQTLLLLRSPLTNSPQNLDSSAVNSLHMFPFAIVVARCAPLILDPTVKISTAALELFACMNNFLGGLDPAIGGLNSIVPSLVQILSTALAVSSTVEVSSQINAAIAGRIELMPSAVPSINSNGVVILPSDLGAHAIPNPQLSQMNLSNSSSKAGRIESEPVSSLVSSSWPANETTEIEGLKSASTLSPPIHEKEKQGNKLASLLTGSEYVSPYSVNVSPTTAKKEKDVKDPKEVNKDAPTKSITASSIKPRSSYSDNSPFAEPVFGSPKKSTVPLESSSLGLGRHRSVATAASKAAVAEASLFSLADASSISSAVSTTPIKKKREQPQSSLAVIESSTFTVPLSPLSTPTSTGSPTSVTNASASSSYAAKHLAMKQLSKPSPLRHSSHAPATVSSPPVSSLVTAAHGAPTTAPSFDSLNSHPPMTSSESVSRNSSRARARLRVTADDVSQLPSSPSMIEKHNTASDSVQEDPQKPDTTGQIIESDDVAQSERAAIAIRGKLDLLKRRSRQASRSYSTQSLTGLIARENDAESSPSSNTPDSSLSTAAAAQESMATTVSAINKAHPEVREISNSQEDADVHSVPETTSKSIVGGGGAYLSYQKPSPQATQPLAQHQLKQPLQGGQQQATLTTHVRRGNQFDRVALEQEFGWDPYSQHPPSPNKPLLRGKKAFSVEAPLQNASENDLASVGALSFQSELIGGTNHQQSAQDQQNLPFLPPRVRLQSDTMSSQTSTPSAFNGHSIQSSDGRSVDDFNAPFNENDRGATHSAKSFFSMNSVSGGSETTASPNPALVSSSGTRSGGSFYTSSTSNPTSFRLNRDAWSGSVIDTASSSSFPQNPMNPSSQVSMRSSLLGSPTDTTRSDATTSATPSADYDAVHVNARVQMRSQSSGLSGPLKGLLGRIDRSGSAARGGSGGDAFPASASTDEYRKLITSDSSEDLFSLTEIERAAAVSHSAGPAGRPHLSPLRRNPRAVALLQPLSANAAVRRQREPSPSSPFFNQNDSSTGTDDMSASIADSGSQVDARTLDLSSDVASEAAGGVSSADYRHLPRQRYQTHSASEVGRLRKVARSPLLARSSIRDGNDDEVNAGNTSFVSTSSAGIPSVAPNTESLYTPSSELKPFTSDVNAESALRAALREDGLMSENWEKAFEACVSIRRLALHHVVMLVEGGVTSIADEGLLHACVLGLLPLVDSLRSSVAKISLITFSDLFAGLGRAMDVEIETVAASIVKRSADTNEFISQAADASLASMILHCSESRVVNALLGCSMHKNQLTRLKTAVWIDRAVSRLGDRILGVVKTAVIDRIVATAQKYSLEGNVEARHAGIRMLQGLRACLPGKSSARVRAASESVVGRDVPVDSFDLDLGAYILTGGGGGGGGTGSGSATPKLIASPSRGGVRGGESRGSLLPVSPLASASSAPSKFPASKNEEVVDDVKDSDSSAETELTNALRLLDSATWKDRVAGIDTISKRATSLTLSAADAVRIADALASRLTDGHAKVGQAASLGIHQMLGVLRGDIVEKVVLVLLPGLSAAMISTQKTLSQTASSSFDLLIANADAGLLLQPVVALVRGSSNQKLIAATLAKLAKLIPAAYLRKPLQLLRVAMPPVLEILEGGVSNQDVRAALSTVVKSLSSCFGESAILESASGSSVSEATLDRLKSILRSPLPTVVS